MEFLRQIWLTRHHLTLSSDAAVLDIISGTDPGHVFALKASANIFVLQCFLPGLPAGLLGGGLLRLDDPAFFNSLSRVDKLCGLLLDVGRHFWVQWLGMLIH